MRRRLKCFSPYFAACHAIFSTLDQITIDLLFRKFCYKCEIHYVFLLCFCYDWSSVSNGKAIFSHSLSAPDCFLSDQGHGFGRAHARWMLHIANCYRISRLSSATAKHALAKLPINKCGDDLSQFFPYGILSVDGLMFVEGAWILRLNETNIWTDLSRVYIQ